MDIERLIRQMTLEEKASLLSGQDFWHTKAIERLGIPAFMVSDGPHGLRKQDDQGDHMGVNDSIEAVCFPAACATAASFDRCVVRALGEALGDACQHENLSVILGPAVNIKRSPLCGRNFEYFSEDPFLTGEMASSMIQGVQSRNVGTSIKHFACNSQEHRRMSSDSVVDERTLREIYFPAFEKAVKQAQPWSVMCSYNRVNGTYASENRFLLTDVLRKEWGFRGFVVSDWGAVNDRVKGVEAGLDLEMPSSGGTNDARIVRAVRSGQLQESEVDEAVRRLLTTLSRYLEHRAPDTVWDKNAQHDLARKLAADCMVLLKNDMHTLPLSPSEKVAVIGEFARHPRFQGGGSSHIRAFRVESLLDALSGNGNITFAQGYDPARDEPDDAMIQEAVAVARASDKAVIVAGLPDSYESEGYDRSHMRLPRSMNELITRVASANSNTVVVLYNGSPVEMPWIGRVRAVVEAYLGGQAVGGATRDVLYGTVNPSGRLPESFPYHLEDSSAFLSYGGEKDRAVYSEGIFVGYRYYDKKHTDLLFPFGYGLSYTSFSYSDLTLDRRSMPDTGTLRVSVSVTNTGDVAGKEVVQLYVSDRESHIFRPLRELKGFTKVELQPGETRTVTFSLDRRAFAYWDADIHDWNVETGTFAIQIGRSCREIVLEEEVEVVSTSHQHPDVTVNSILLDLQEDPEAMEMVQDFMKAMNPGDTLQGSEAAREAITDEMNRSFMQYLPLRGIVSFAGGTVPYDDLCSMVDAFNRKRREKA